MLLTPRIFTAIRLGILVGYLSGLISGQEAESHSADPAAHLSVPDGLEVTLVAESPLLYNPTAMDVDARGRLWVTEAVNYRRWNGRNPGHELPGGDRVVILEDTTGDGVYDASKVFVQEEALVSPLGIAVIGQSVYVSCSPDLIVYTDRDGDDVPDERRVLLSGFGGHDHDHGLHSMVFGPDGRHYLAAGNAGPHLVTDAGGQSLRSGSLYSGGGQFTADNKPGLISDDGRAWTGGLALRMEQDATDLTVVAHNFRNNYELTLDAFGNVFQSDNDDDGNQGCRFLWCMEGGNHGYFSADGSRSWSADRRPGQSTQDAHWHQDDPGVVPAGTITGAGGPTGVAMYEGQLLKPWIDGNLLATDAGAGALYAFDVMPKGAGFQLETTALLGGREADESRDARWFRPSDVVVDVDGTVLVADWFDPGVGGHAMGDRETYGRILRVAPEGHRRFVPGPDVTRLAGAVEALNGPTVSGRAEAWRALQARLEDMTTVEETVSALRSQFESSDPRVRARALWVLGTAGDEGLARASAALHDPHPEVRVTAIRVLSRRLLEHSPEAFLSLVGSLAEDPSPAVRRELALALRDMSWPLCGETLVALCRQLDPEDRFEIEALGVGADGKQEQLFARLIEDAGEAGAPTRWDSRLARLAWRLHPDSAVSAFAERAQAEELPVSERKMALDALAFVPTREAADAMLDLALAGPSDTVEAARWWVDFRIGNDWRDHDLGEQLDSHGVDSAEIIWTSELVTRGGIDVDVDVSGGQVLWLIADDAGNGNGCDWVDWLHPRLVGPSGELDLTKEEWVEAKTAWGSVRRGLDCEGGELRVDGIETSDGIGTHAPTHIGFKIPDGYERFTAFAGVDDTGATRPGAPTSVHFSVGVERAPGIDGLLALRDVVLDTDAEEEVREAAALELAEDPLGGHLALALAADGNLGEDLHELVGEALFRHPDFAVRALASAFFTRADASGEPLPPVDELLALEGDPVHGRDVFLSKETQCATCHAVTRDGVRRGGDLGPELTSIASKYGAPELLDAILNPNAGVAFGYETWSWEERSGRVVSGFLLAESEDQLVIKDTTGKRQVLDAGEVVGRRQHKLSTMPEGLALGMTAQDLADLLAFLREDVHEPLQRGAPLTLLGSGADGSLTGLEGWVEQPGGAVLEDMRAWSAGEGALLCEGQPIGYLRTRERFTNYELELEWRFDPELGAGNSGVLLRVIGEDKVWPKSIESQLHAGNAGDLWNIESFGMAADLSRTSGRRTTRRAPSSEKPLGEWNHSRITLDRGRLEVVVNGVVQNTATWCDEVPGYIALQSEGAPIQFRNVVLTPLLRSR
ncbi:MAG: DUF1080 domain-containing protein [Planctomycetota bacterium]|nr:DUF1080 domain-containing protein [Planctomycetota bacterium]